MRMIKYKAIVILILVAFSGSANAAWQPSGVGTVQYVRAYSPANNGNLRVQFKVTSGAAHSCGNFPNEYYFDSDKVPLEVVKSVLALSTTAMVSGKSVLVTYDCTIGGGSYGWGVALKVIE